MHCCSAALAAVLHGLPQGTHSAGMGRSAHWRHGFNADLPHRLPGPAPVACWPWSRCAPCSTSVAATLGAPAQPVGDGHPVVVFPGLGGAPFTTSHLRAPPERLRASPAHCWGRGVNTGPEGDFDDWLGALDERRARAARAARPQGQPGRLEPGRRLCPRARQALPRVRAAGRSRWARRSRRCAAQPCRARLQAAQRRQSQLTPAMQARLRAMPAGAHHLDLQQDRRRGVLARLHRAARRARRRTSRSAPATWAW